MRGQCSTEHLVCSVSIQQQKQWVPRKSMLIKDLTSHLSNKSVVIIPLKLENWSIVMVDNWLSVLTTDEYAFAWNKKNGRMYYQNASLLHYLDEVLSGIFDDDFRLSDSESSEEEGENVYTYSGKRNLAGGEVVALSKAVSSEPTEDHNDPGDFSVMSAVPLACYDSGSEDNGP